MLTIGLINNMPTSAIRSTERQFDELLRLAAQDMPLELRWFRLSGARPATYGRLEDLWASELDGLIVTGAEPRASVLSEEPFWAPLTRTIDWAAQHTISSIWSCLAAHAAVLHLDGVERRRFDEKIFGVFACTKTIEHEMLTNLHSWAVPH